MATFIQAGPGDAGALAGIMRDFYAEEHMAFGGESEAALRRLLASPDAGRVFLIEQDGQTAGYLVVTFGFSLERGGRTALLDELYIVPAARRRGLGKAALGFAIEAARGAGCHAIHLEVAHVNPTAQKLYKSAGFVQEPRAYLSLGLRDF